MDLGAPGVNILSTQPDREGVRMSDGFEANDFAARWDAHVDQGTTSAWGRTNTSAASGSFSIADSPAGNYANNSNSYADLRTPVNLTGRARMRRHVQGAATSCSPATSSRSTAVLNNGIELAERMFTVSGSTGGAYWRATRSTSRLTESRT